MEALMHPKNYVLATAEILYRMPDPPHLLQTYIWQDYDLEPRFPKLQGFLDFWGMKIDGKLFDVTVVSSGLLVPRFRHTNSLMRIH